VVCGQQVLLITCCISCHDHGSALQLDDTRRKRAAGSLRLAQFVHPAVGQCCQLQCYVGSVGGGHHDIDYLVARVQAAV
jgi:hypothetical protein